MDTNDEAEVSEIWASLASLRSSWEQNSGFLTPCPTSRFNIPWDYRDLFTWLWIIVEIADSKFENLSFHIY